MLYAGRAFHKPRGTVTIWVYRDMVWVLPSPGKRCPFRETETAMATARVCGILAVEMGAAGLYTFVHVRDRAVICLDQVTNQTGTIEGDFEKCEANGTDDAFSVISMIVARLI